VFLSGNHNFIDWSNKVMIAQTSETIQGHKKHDG